MKYYFNEYAGWVSGIPSTSRQGADQMVRHGDPDGRIALLIITKTPNRPATFKRLAVKKASKK